MRPVDFELLTRSPDLQRFFHLTWRLFQVTAGLYVPGDKSAHRFGPDRTRADLFAALQKVPASRQRGVECDHRHMEIAMKRGQVLRYRCHMGLTEFIIPIAAEGEVVAFLQSGQVLDARPKAADWLKVQRSLGALSVDAVPLQPLFHRLRVIPPRQQRDLIALLELFGNYIARAQKRISLLEESWPAQLVGRTRLYVTEHLARDLSLDAIARAVGTSKRNLTRVFQRETRMTVLDFVHARRIAVACQLLASTSRPCTWIALECGFGSIQQFNRIFKKLQGTTPLAWRRKHADRSS